LDAVNLGEDRGEISWVMFPFHQRHPLPYSPGLVGLQPLDHIGNGWERGGGEAMSSDV
jgi:hypothetical protein